MPLKKFGGRTSKVIKYLNELLFFSLVLRFLLESYLELYLCALVNLDELLWTTSGEIIASILSIMFMFIFTFMPFVTHYFI
jgi:hypothetical protein